ncbi:MAG TPA: hypothetical protein VKB10_07260 [Gaiellaceae bacterium]|nr:hypothetical protein [Gaiellaceae bacterium]
MTPEEEGQLAVDLFNHAWTLIELPKRTPEQDDELIHAAHASRHHWSRVGTAKNLARGEWQLARVYATLSRAEPALHHAGRCLAYCEANPDAIEDWDVPFAYEALARAHGVAGDAPESRRWAEEARELGAKIEDPEDRELLERDLATL